MKAINIILFYILVSTCNCLGATEIFQYDKNKINASLQNVTAAENYIEKNNLNYNEAFRKNPSVIQHANLSWGENLLTNRSDLPLEIPSFIWGCCLVVIGVIVVCISTNMNENEAGKVIAGCLINGAVLAAGFTIYEILKAIGDSCSGWGWSC